MFSINLTDKIGMSLFTWRDEYSVHNTQIDQQHKELFNLAGQLHSAMMRGAGRMAVAETLSKLIDYTAHHFRDEEILMRASKFPQYETHKAEHDGFVAVVTKLQRGLNEGHVTVSVDTMQFLRNWLEKHIMGRDQLVAKHIAGPNQKVLTGAGKH